MNSGFMFHGIFQMLRRQETRPPVRGWRCFPLLLLLVWSAAAQVTERPAGSAANLEVKAATDRYLAEVSSEKKARSDAYFEGGYWLMLWDFLYGAAVAVVLLETRVSAQLRDGARRLSRFSPIQTSIYWSVLSVVTAALTFPLTCYEGYIREHQYGLATQTFGPWLGDGLKNLGVTAVLGSLLFMLLFGVVRCWPRSWHVLGCVVTIAFMCFNTLISPVFIAPLFNRYTPLADPKVVEPILRLARANGVPAHDVYQFDASRQTTRISANVSGFLGTERIFLNDNLLKRCDLPEIEAVMAHELGHYVLHHAYKYMLFAGLLVIAGSLWLRWGLEGLLQWRARRWGLEGVGDLAVTPLAILLITSYLLVLTPVINTFVRTQEYEADLFGLNAARQPDGFARVTLKLGEYRKLDPRPAEEWFFYDHPSGRTRITAAMRWKAENLGAR